MARTGSETTPTPADHQQMDRSNDPEETRRLDAAAAETSMITRHARAGSAVGVGSVAFDDPGAYDVGDGERDPQDDPIVPPEAT